MTTSSNPTLVENILQGHADALGGDLTAYKNHIYRVLRFFSALGGECPEQVVIAAAFHDLGIWTNRTFDYLAPSVQLARDFLEATDRGPACAEVEAIIVNHHKLRRYRGPFMTNVELFRRADLIDVSLGLVRFRLASDQVKKIRATYPNAGFHRRLVDLTARQFVRHPFHPLPMMRW